MRPIVVITVLFVSVMLSAQTSIVVLRDPRTILVASDSLGSTQQYEKITMCKVWRLTRDIFYTLAGKQIEIKPGQVYSTFRQVADDFITRTPMKAYLTDLRRTNPSDYRRFMFKDEGKEEIIFFTMDKRTPSLARVDMWAHEDNKHNINVDVKKEFLDGLTCPPPRSICSFTAGLDDEMMPVLSGPLVSDVTEDTVHRLIQMEISAHPDKVGPPVRVLQLDGKGARWITNGEGCNLGIPGEKKAVPKSKNR